MNECKAKDCLLVGMIASVVLFLFAIYDTVTAHAITAVINEGALQYLVVTSEAQGWQHHYYEAIKNLDALGSAELAHFIILLLLGYCLLNKKFTAISYCLIAIAIIFTVVQMFKWNLATSRPLYPLELDSFPSGHTARAAIWCGMILLLNYLKVFSLPRYWQGVFLAVPVIEGYCRIALGRHWLSDVIASLALGFIVFASIIYVHKRIHK